MNISETIPALKNCIQQWQLAGQRIGFVPTMGYLHAGHIELVKQAKAACDKVVVSIFVNPLQFDQASDLSAYPESLKEDQQKLIAAQVDCLFLPDSSMMYPDGQTVVTKISVPEITSELEGEHRPGHFDGVATVVNKLFNLVQPQVAYFGEKDYQQLLLVKKMVADLNMPIEISSVATYRESDGLAMSSRNSRLSAAHRAKAPALYRALQQVAERLKLGKMLLNDIETEAVEQLQASGFEVEYISVRDRTTMCQPTNQQNNRMVLAAVHLGKVRLIDNLFID